MSRTRVAVFTMFVGVAACTDSDGPRCGEPGACGSDYQYVAKNVSIASTPEQALMDGFDLDGDGTPDNQLGVALASLAPAINVSAAVSQAVAEQRYIILAHLIAGDFTDWGRDSTGAGIGLYRGGYPESLDGTPSFDAYESRAGDTLLDASIAGGSMTGGPGSLALPFSVGGEIFLLHAHHVHVEAGGLSEAGIGTLRLSGSVALSAIQEHVLPELRAQVPSGTLLDESMFVSDMDDGVPSMSFALRLGASRATFDIKFPDLTAP
ncbi:hypothetical protein BH11MYX2_BH11MYX2_16610 [soil metagenome]